jgi:hypothetical protein
MNPIILCQGQIKERGHIVVHKQLTAAPSESRGSSTEIIIRAFYRYSASSVLFGFLLITLLKLVLVSNQDIVAWYRPHDDYWQILSAAHSVWWRPYSEWTLMHLPVYPVFVAVMGAIGLPLRLAIELLYIGGAAALAFAFGRLGLPKLLQVILFGLIVFHPYSPDSITLSQKLSTRV